MSDGLELLRRYAETGCEIAFAELIRRHIDLVYSAALRLVGGDPQHAEDVTQQVFAELARQAKNLTRHPALTGWLYKTARQMARRTARTEQRRRAREHEAYTMNEILRESAEQLDWTHLGPILEDAMHGLAEKDRLAVLLRFFEKKELKEIGRTLGLSENAARMRVSRALDKLRIQLARKGLTSSCAALAVTLTHNAVSAAPQIFVQALMSAPLAGATAATGPTVTLLKTIAMTKIKTGILSVVVLAGVATPILVQHKSLAKLRKENQQLREQSAQIDGLRAQNEQLSRRISDRVDTSQPIPNNLLAELLKLRGEVTQLRNDSQELSRLKVAEAHDPLSGNAKAWAGQVHSLRNWLAQNPHKSIPELGLLNDQAWFDAVGNTNVLQTDRDFREALDRLRRTAKNQFAPMIQQALRRYAQDNAGGLPTNLAQLQPYFELSVDPVILQRYQIASSGIMTGIPSNQPVVMEKAPVDNEYDTMFLIYANGTAVASAKGWPTAQQGSNQNSN